MALLFSDVRRWVSSSWTTTPLTLLRAVHPPGRRGNSYGRDYATCVPEPEDNGDAALYPGKPPAIPKAVYRHFRSQALIHMMLGWPAPRPRNSAGRHRNCVWRKPPPPPQPLGTGAAVSFTATGLFSGFLLPARGGQKVVLLPMGRP